MKIVFGLIIVVLSTYLGYLFSQKYVSKKNFYLDFFAFHKKLKNEVGFSSNSIKNIIERTEITKKSHFNVVLENYFLQNNFNEIKLDKHIFSNDDTEYVKKYISNIGSLDKKTQLEFLSSCDVELQEKVNKSELEAKKYKSLCIKLGFLIGLIGMIILI